MTKRTTNIIRAVYIITLVLLLSTIAVLGIALVNKDRENKATNAALNKNNGSLAEISEKIEQYEQEIEKYSSMIDDQQKNNSELQSKLEQAQKDKKQLEDEIAAVKKQMEQLSAKKKAERLASLLSLGEALQSGKMPTDKVCYLTFDDGPSGNTLKILDVLKKYNDIKATFFVVGTARLDYLPRMHNAGHMIALHTNSHRYNEIYKNEAAYLADLQAIQNAVESRIGVKSRLVRFPGGSSNGISKQYCPGIMTALSQRLPEMGYSYFDWNVDSGDANGKNKSAASIARSVLQQAEGKRSICVLMHDTSARSNTVTALPTVIEGLIQMGFRFEPLTAESFGFHHGVTN